VTVCYPGPIATGEPGTPRSVYGPEGLITEHEERGGKKSRMNPARVAELIVRATYHGLDTAWIAKHPVLLLGDAPPAYFLLGEDKGFTTCRRPCRDKPQSFVVESEGLLTVEWSGVEWSGVDWIRSLNSQMSQILASIECVMIKHGGPRGARSPA
jgi:hypothetical protein